jgi:hypothetical protein
LGENGAGTCWFSHVDVETLPALRRYLVVALAGHVAEWLDGGRNLDAFPARAALALECSSRRGPWATWDELHAHIVRLHHRGHDAKAEVDAYRWEDSAVAEATEEAAGMLERGWQRVLKSCSNHQAAASTSLLTPGRS